MASPAPRTHLLTLVVLLVSACAGWGLVHALQRPERSAVDVDGCLRRGSMMQQASCLGTEFEAQARDAGRGLDGRARERAVIAYVRSVERAAASDERLAAMCHPGMHQVGRAEGARAAANDVVPTFPNAATQLCTAGYVHGLAEGYLTDTPSAQVGAIYPSLCHDVAARDGCAHGIGHALLRGQQSTAPRRAAERAAHLCAELPGAAQSHCHNGVYMELAMRTKPAPMPAAEFIDTCRQITNDVVRELACWSYLPVSLTSNDVAIDAKPGWCARAPFPGQLRCIESVGREYGARRVTSCAGSGRASVEQRCIEGAVSLDVGSGHVAAADALASCGRFPSSQLGEYCRGAVQRYARARVAVEQGTPA